MSSFTTEYWPETYSRVEFFPTASPPDLPVSAVKIYVFQDDTLLLGNIMGRGWDLPGGHVEEGEAPERAVARELKEETGAEVKRVELIGYLKVTNEKENERNKKYPKVACVLVYKGYEVAMDADHTFELEATASKFVLLDVLPSIHHEWNEFKAQVVAYAHDF